MVEGVCGWSLTQSLSRAHKRGRQRTGRLRRKGKGCDEIDGIFELQAKEHFADEAEALSMEELTWKKHCDVASRKKQALENFLGLSIVVIRLSSPVVSSCIGGHVESSKWVAQCVQHQDLFQEQLFFLEVMVYYCHLRTTSRTVHYHHREWCHCFAVMFMLSAIWKSCLISFAHFMHACFTCYKFLPRSWDHSIGSTRTSGTRHCKISCHMVGARSNSRVGHFLQCPPSISLRISMVSGSVGTDFWSSYWSLSLYPAVSTETDVNGSLTVGCHSTARTKALEANVIGVSARLGRTLGDESASEIFSVPGVLPKLRFLSLMIERTQRPCMNFSLPSACQEWRSLVAICRCVRATQHWRLQFFYVSWKTAELVPAESTSQLSWANTFPRWCSVRELEATAGVYGEAGTLLDEEVLDLLAAQDSTLFKSTAPERKPVMSLNPPPRVSPLNRGAGPRPVVSWLLCCISMHLPDNFRRRGGESCFDWVLVAVLSLECLFGKWRWTERKGENTGTCRLGKQNGNRQEKDSGGTQRDQGLEVVGRWAVGPAPDAASDQEPS